MRQRKLNFPPIRLWPHRLANQIALLTIILFSVGIVFFSVHVARENAEFTARQIQQSGEALAKNISVTGSAYLFSTYYKPLEELLMQAADFPNVDELEVLDSDGIVIRGAKRLANGGVKIYWNKYQYKIPLQIATRTIEKNDQRIVIWYPIVSGILQGWVRVEMGLERLQQKQAEIYLDILSLGAAILLAMLVIMLLYMRRPMQVLATLTEFASRLDKKHGEAIVINKNSKELMRLGNALNKVSSELQQQEIDIRSALQALESQKAALDEHSIVSIVDVHGKIIYANDKFCVVTEYSREELIGQDHRIFKSDMHGEAFYQDLWRTITHGQVWKGEICNKSKTGKLCWFENTIVPFLDEQHKPYQYVAISTEITRLRQLAADLKESQQRLQQSQVFSNIGNWEWDIDTDRIIWSEQVSKMFDLGDIQREASFGRFIGAIKLGDQGRVTAAIDACLKGDKDYDIEHRVVWLDRSVHWLHEKGNVVRDEAGRPVRMLGIAQDTTQRHQTENLNARIGRIMDSAFDEIYLFDVANLELVQANSRALKNLGVAKSEIGGIRLESLFADINHAAFRQMAPDLYKKKQDEVLFESSLKRKDGSFSPVEVRVQILPHEEPPMFLVIAQDISRRKEAEESLRAIEEHMRQSQKIEAIGTLAGGIAHDFNNILTAIIGYTDLNLMDMEVGSDIWNNQNQILTASYRAKDLVNQILTFSRESAEEIQLVNPEQIVGEAMRLLRATIPTLTELRYSGVDDKVFIRISPTEFHQIVINLCVNASHAFDINQKGIISVSLKRVVHIHEHLVFGGVIPVGDYVVLEISDTGCGIDPDILPFIFDPFFTTKEVDVGTGMGLSVVYGIVNKAGGGIVVESRQGGGTKFSIYFPQVEKDAAL